MDKSNSVIVPVAKAGEFIAEAVEITTTFKRASKLTSKQDDHKGKVWVSLELANMPELVNEDGSKATIIRTLKQAYNDLDLFAPTATSVQGVLLSMKRYATNKPVTLNISAHEKGAKLKVTPVSNYHIDNGGKFKTGETVTLDKAGFYVEGFLDIQFSDADIDKKLDAIERSTAFAEENSLD